MTRNSLLLAALLVAAVAIGAPARAAAQESAQPKAAAHETEAGKQASGEHEAEEGEHDAGWMPVIAKATNFAILAGVLIYFLRSPVTGYLNGRIAKVREDLVTAAQTRETAQRQLAEIDARLKALPADIEALKKRGAEDLVAERARIEQAAEAEQHRLLEHTRREIDMRLRVAKRELVELTANLAVGVASDRIKRNITPEDQARMVDRYAAQVGGEVRP
jgi:F-type H+-transporting ATPase subunit b